MACGQAHIPVLNCRPHPPIVGETKDHCASQPAAKPALICHASIAAFASPPRAGSPCQIRPAAAVCLRQHLQAGQVIFKRRPLMQVNIEADKIHALGTKEFGRRIVGERAKAVRVRALGFLDQFVNETATLAPRSSARCPAESRWRR